MKSPAQPSPFERPIKFPNVLVNTVDEESPLLDHADGGTREDQPAKQGGGNPLTASVMAILLLGELISHADTTLIFAAAPQIASELGSLRGVGWLATSYTLGVCSMQPLYGRLSDIFGRKAMLLFAYCILSIGCIICGTSTTLFQIIIGRAISGIGGAGVMTMASIIITDSVPKRDFAKYRSYINLATTLGRSIGGPIGGFISDYLGWQWLFWIRIPFFALSISLILISLKGDVDQTPDTDSDDSMQKQSFRQKWRKVDYKGALLLAKAIVSLILLLDVAGTGAFSPSVAFLTASVVVFGHLFVFWELFGAETPIFNLRILAKPNATLSYLVDYFQVFAQVGMMFSVPMYFQVTQRAPATASGAHIVPAVVANTFGALVSGKLMHISHCNGSGPLGWRLCRQARILLHSAIELILESSILKKI
ncbi:major facilitator superfamily domain-containing protein [Ilyonectria destructans]|nr:major facilitator superfamily domain-containing protein [Ilyonectria destructans]